MELNHPVVCHRVGKEAGIKPPGGKGGKPPGDKPPGRKGGGKDDGGKEIHYHYQPDRDVYYVSNVFPQWIPGNYWYDVPNWQEVWDEDQYCEGDTDLQEWCKDNDYGKAAMSYDSPDCSCCCAADPAWIADRINKNDVTLSQYNSLCGRKSDRCYNPHSVWVDYHNEKIQPVFDTYDWPY